MKLPLLLAAGFCLTAAIFRGQTETPSEVRVSVVLNPDHSRTTYQTDPANKKTTAITTDAGGKLREKIVYELDENGRFARGEVYGPGEQFRFTALYKYDANNHVVEETHLAKDKTVVGKLLFQYDAVGHRVGYQVYDGAGKLLGQTKPGKASASPPRSRHQ